jgi:ABC-type uncharacterized transport system involved in gliding motility auxiliary subunit
VDTAFPDGPPKPPEAAKPQAAAKPDATDPPEDEPSESKPAETTAAPTNPAQGPATPAADWVKTSVQPINIVVVADTDMLDDRFWLQSQDFFGHRITVPTANNGDFVANAVEVLAGGNDLIGLRSRGTSARPFLVVDRIERDAQERYSAEESVLQQKLKDTQARLAELTGKDQANAPTTLSPEQAKTIEEFRTDMLQTRRQLRDVQAALRGDIGRLKAGLEFLDIALIPIIVAAVAVFLGTVRLKRRGRRATEA